MLNSNDNEKQREHDKKEKPKQARTVRKASVQAQQKSQTQTQQDDSDSDEFSLSDPECDGDKPDEDTVLTDLDKRKALLNKNLPKGTKVVKLSKHCPIKEVAYQVIDGHKIIHYSRSIVKFDDLRKGMKVTRAYRELINEIGLKGDQVGHILPFVLGGGLEYNVFPHNPATNVEYCHEHFARLAVEFLEQNEGRNAHVEYQVRLIYNPGQTRPYGFYVLVRGYINGKLVIDFNRRGYIFEWLSNPHPDDPNY
jgi:hypothetical protein